MSPSALVLPGSDVVMHDLSQAELELSTHSKPVTSAHKYTYVLKSNASRAARCTIPLCATQPGNAGMFYLVVLVQCARILLSKLSNPVGLPTQTSNMCRSWTIDKKGELTTAAKRDKAHKSRVTSIVASGGFLYSASLNGSIKMWDAQVWPLSHDLQNRSFAPLLCRCQSDIMPKLGDQGGRG